MFGCIHRIHRIHNSMYGDSPRPEMTYVYAGVCMQRFDVFIRLLWRCIFRDSLDVIYLINTILILSSVQERQKYFLIRSVFCNQNISDICNCFVDKHL